MKKEREVEKEKFNVKLATFIVDKRKAFYLIYICLAIFCIISMDWTKVNDTLTDYLPEHTETRVGLEIMDQEFVTYATANVMVDNITYAVAEKLAEALEQLEGVKEVTFDNTETHYSNASALFSVTFSGISSDPLSQTGLDHVEAYLEAYDTYVTSDVGNQAAGTIASEMNVVMVIAAVIIILVLLFTSKTYMEIPVLLITFCMAALLNMGTNYWFGTISFVSNSIAVVLQLALAIDYAIILCHRYTEERMIMPAREAAITALSKALIEISGSSLTTLSGLAAMAFMQFKIGYDMGIVLMKAIVMSLLSVFTLMPGLLFTFNKLIDKTQHKNFVPKISGWGKLVIKLRYVVPPIFAILLIGSFFLSNNCPYVYGYTELKTVTKNESQIAQETIEETFGKNNMLAMMVPAGNYEKEANLLKRLEAVEEVDTILGLGNVEAMDGYMLTDKLTPRQFAELTDLDIELARFIYSAYAAEDELYGKIISGVDQYSVPLMDMFLFVYDQVDAGYITLDEDLNETLEEVHTQLEDAMLQLKGEHYSRFVMNLTVPEEGKATFELLDTLHQIAEDYYSEGVYLAGNATSNYDLSSAFKTDNIMISVLSTVFVMTILLLMFQSSGIPILLILVIQGSVWMNFSFPVLRNESMFFMSYLVVSAIQMGANIDYAIVITNRYTQLKQTMPLKEAIIEALNQSFPTIITSGSILAVSGYLIGYLSSDGSISSIGFCIGRGTVISIILVMGVLPQILVLGDFIIEKTSFKFKKPTILEERAGSMKVDGYVKGYISGMVEGHFSGSLQGEMKAVLESGNITTSNVKEQEVEANETSV